MYGRVSNDTSHLKHCIKLATGHTEGVDKEVVKIEQLWCSVLFEIRSEYEGILTAFEQYSCQVVFDGQDFWKVVENYK